MFSFLANTGQDADQEQAGNEDSEEVGLLTKSVDESCSISVQPQRMSRDGVSQDQEHKSRYVASQESVLPSRAQLSETLDKCINLMDNEEVKTLLKQAGAKKEDLQETLMSILMKHGVSKA
jgi:hypothetical protein